MAYTNFENVYIPMSYTTELQVEEVWKGCYREKALYLAVSDINYHNRLWKNNVIGF